MQAGVGAAVGVVGAVGARQLVPMEAVRTALAAPLSTAASGVVSISRTPLDCSDALSVGGACCAPAISQQNRENTANESTIPKNRIGWICMARSSLNLGNRGRRQ